MTILGEKFPPAPLTGFSPRCLAETFGVGENPSGNAYCSGRGLATIGAAMANRGVFKGSKVRTDHTHSDKVGLRRHRKIHKKKSSLILTNDFDLFTIVIIICQLMSEEGWCSLHDKIKKGDIWG